MIRRVSQQSRVALPAIILQLILIYLASLVRQVQRSRTCDTWFVYLLIYKSNRNYDAGWKENIYNVTHYAQRNTIL
jgi:hypothetical protein